MEENQQKKYDQIIKRRMQEAKEEGVPYVPPPASYMQRIGAQIAQSEPPVAGQVITLRTGAIKVGAVKQPAEQQVVEPYIEVSQVP